MDTKPNYGFIAITIAMCAIFGGLQWLFLQQIEIAGMFESWIVRSALMLSVVLTGVMIYLKFGRANTGGQNITLWVGLVIEMVIMAFTFVIVVHPDAVRGTDIEQFAEFISGLNAITTVFALIVYLALDIRAHEQYSVQRQREGLVNEMYMQALDSREVHDLVKAQARENVVKQLAEQMQVPAYQLRALLPQDPHPTPPSAPTVQPVQANFLAQAPSAEAIKSNGHSK